MNKRKVISWKSLPAQVPILKALMSHMAMDYYQAPSWLYGVVWTFWSLVILSGLWKIATDEYIDILDKEK